MITFEGTSVKELEKDFRSAVDEYLQTCKKIGREPGEPFFRPLHGTDALRTSLRHRLDG